MEDTQNEIRQIINHLEKHLNKAHKAIQEMNDNIKKSNVRIIGLPVEVERETIYNWCSMKLFRRASKPFGT